MGLPHKDWRQGLCIPNSQSISLGERVRAGSEKSQEDSGDCGQSETLQPGLLGRRACSRRTGKAGRF